MCQVVLDKVLGLGSSIKTPHVKVVWDCFYLNQPRQFQTGVSVLPVASLHSRALQTGSVSPLTILHLNFRSLRGCLRSGVCSLGEWLGCVN